MLFNLGCFINDECKQCSSLNFNRKVQCYITVSLITSIPIEIKKKRILVGKEELYYKNPFDRQITHVPQERTIDTIWLTQMMNAERD